MEDEGDSILIEENYYQLLNVSKTVTIASHEHVTIAKDIFTLSPLYNLSQIDLVVNFNF